MTSISKVTLNAANERPLPLWCVTDPLLGQEVGEKFAVEHESVVTGKPRRGDLPMHYQTHFVNYYPRPVLAFGFCCCLRLCVCVCQSVCQSLACPRDNSAPVQVGITKFGPKVQKNLVTVPIVLWSDRP